MSWWLLAASTAASVISSLNSAASQSDQNEAQQEWNEYNAYQDYYTSMENIAATEAIGTLNATLAMYSAEISAQLAVDAAEYNASLIQETIDYNNELYEEELSQLWDAAELDQLLLAQERAVERGEIEGQQASSGVLMGQDSNADVLIDSMTQEALDSLVIEHNADLAAADINNARAQSEWEGQQEIYKTLFEGQISAFSSYANGLLSAAGTLATTSIQVDAMTYSAESALESALAGASYTYDYNQSSIESSLVSSLFSTASTALASYYSAKSVETADSSTDTGSDITNTSSKSLNSDGSEKVSTTYTYQEEGSSLIG